MVERRRRGYLEPVSNVPRGEGKRLNVGGKTGR